MSTPTFIFKVLRRSRSTVALATMLCFSPLAAQAQFNNSGVVQDWYNQALPKAWSPSSPLGVNASNSMTLGGNTPFVTSATGIQNWRLGVYKQDLDVGTLVAGVEPNSPAARAGLKKDDLIVSINGQQVGNTPSNGYVDVGLQASNSAVNGRVVALIADGITGKLRNVNIQLEQTTLTIDVSVRLADRVALPTSFLTITLRNQSRPQYEVVGARWSGTMSGSGPMNFKMMVEPKSIVPTDRYQFVAQIDDMRGAIQYVTVQDVDVNRLLSGSLPMQVLVLENYQQWLARNSTSNNGQVIQASYADEMEAIFQSILGRSPNNEERLGWTRFLSEGNSKEEMRIRLLSHASFYDRVGNNPSAFIAQMIQILSGRPATPQALQDWTMRLNQLQGYREAVVREYIARMNGQLR